MKTKFNLVTSTALVVLALGPLAAFSQTPVPGAVTTAEKSNKPGETSTNPRNSSSTAQRSSVGNTGAGGVTNAEKSAKPGETSTTLGSGSRTAQGSSAGNTGAGGVTNAEQSAKPGETSTTLGSGSRIAQGSSAGNSSGQGQSPVTTAERSRKADRN